MNMLLIFLGTIFVGSGLSVASSGNGNCALNLGAAKKGLKEVSDKVKELQRNMNSCTNNNKMAAFTATLSKSISLGINEFIRYDNVITNVGKAYTPSTGIFLVPLSGIYTLSVSMMGDPTDKIHLQLVRNGSELVRLWTGGAGSFELASHTINVELIRGDIVWVQPLGSTGQKLHGGGPYNVFSAAFLNHT